MAIGRTSPLGLSRPRSAESSRSWLRGSLPLSIRLTSATIAESVSSEASAAATRCSGVRPVSPGAVPRLLFRVGARIEGEIVGNNG